MHPPCVGNYSIVGFTIYGGSIDNTVRQRTRQLSSELLSIYSQFSLFLNVHELQFVEILILILISNPPYTYKIYIRWNLENNYVYNGCKCISAHEKYRHFAGKHIVGYWRHMA